MVDRFCSRGITNAVLVQSVSRFSKDTHSIALQKYGLGLGNWSAVCCGRLLPEQHCSWLNAPISWLYWCHELLSSVCHSHFMMVMPSLANLFQNFSLRVKDPAPQFWRKLSLSVYEFILPWPGITHSTRYYSIDNCKDVKIDTYGDFSISQTWLSVKEGSRHSLACPVILHRWYGRP